MTSQGDQQDDARQCYTKWRRTVHRVTNLQPSIHLTPQHTVITHTWLTLCKLMVTAGTGKSPPLYIQKHNVTSTVFFKETIIPGIFWVKTNTCD